MKKILFIFILMTILGCKFQHIDFTGKFDCAVDGQIIGMLTLNQEKHELTGFFQWIDKSSNYIYPLGGTVKQKRKRSEAEVKITINPDKPMYVFNGIAKNSDSIFGTFRSKVSVYIDSLKLYPKGTRIIAPIQNSPWMAIRK